MFLDSILPILAFLLLINSGFHVAKAKGFTKHNTIELIISIFILAFSIWKESDNSDKMQDISNANKNLEENINGLHSERFTDSSNNATFQKFVHDSLGYERQGNKAVKIYYNTINQVKPNGQGNNPVPDSLNYLVYNVINSLFISPKEGTWAHGYVAFDSSVNTEDVIHEGMGTGKKEDIIVVNGKYCSTHFWKIYDRAVYNRGPIRVNMSFLKGGYIIFGDEGVPNKRYMYKDFKVTWIPEK